jgi:HK97 family phage major capsid protein
VAFNNAIDRSGAEALIPEEVSNTIIKEAPQGSAMMRLMRRLPNMSRRQHRMPVLSSLVSAYFVNGDTGLKQTSKTEWDNVYINAEELAVIVPIPEAVLDDTDYDIWGEAKPQIVDAFGRAFDQAVLYGINAPDLWPDDVVTAATAAGNLVDLSTVIGAGGDLYDAILGESGVLAKVEEDGYAVTGHVAALSLRAKLRGLRDTSKQPIFMRSMANGQNMQDSARYDLDGSPIEFPVNGAVDAARSLLVSGDYNRLLYSIRQDITYKILTEAVIQDAAGNIIFNLAQQDMVALRCVLRLGWARPNPVNPVQTTAASRYPLAVLVP